MNLKRTATVVVVGGAFAAWLSAAMTPGDRSRPPPTVVPPTPAEAHGAELASEIARLHERLSPDATPRRPSRDLFSFRAGAGRPAAPVTPEPIVPGPVVNPVPEQLPLKLAGIAEDSGADGPVRTAIISTAGQLFLVKEGENVTSSYRVTKISADGVDLADTRDGSARHLELK